MSNSTTQAAVPRGRLFVASCIALTATGMTFAVRGDIMPALGTKFSLNDYQLGLMAGAAFYGFMLSILFGGMLVDLFGMGAIVALAFLSHLCGLGMTIFANGFTMLFAATLIVGIGNGLVEAACNPLVATIYPDQKTHRLNAFHAWFPGGLIIGGLVAYGMTRAGLDWQAKIGAIIVLVVVYGVMFMGHKFPATERVQASVSTGDMYKEVLRPVFLLLFLCMFLTAATELGPNQWIPATLGKLAGASGILVLVFINGVMFVGRNLAGQFVHKISPVGLLACASVLSAVGLYTLGMADTPIKAYASATVFALGICYYWPTMLGLTSERFPKGGSLLLAIMGAAGNLSTALVLPFMGKIYDTHKDNPGIAFQTVALFPVVLVVVFGGLYLSDKAKGGYKRIKLDVPA